MDFSDWVEEQDRTINRGNLFAPALDAQQAVNFLCEYLLGSGWYSYNPVSVEQINTEIVGNILIRYSSRYRKEIKNKQKYRRKVERLDARYRQIVARRRKKTSSGH